jgi:hypothetical protein
MMTLEIGYTGYLKRSMALFVNNILASVSRKSTSTVVPYARTSVPLDGENDCHPTGDPMLTHFRCKVGPAKNPRCSGHSISRTNLRGPQCNLFSVRGIERALECSGIVSGRVPNGTERFDAQRILDGFMVMDCCMSNAWRAQDTHHAGCSTDGKDLPP